VKFLAWDETLFKDPEVFDPDYVPEKLLFRESQLMRITSNLRPALRKSRPINMLCLGPPGTGKTSAVKVVLEDLRSYEDIISVYVNCQLMTSKQAIFAKIFEKVIGYSLPSYGVPFPKIYYSIMNRISKEEKVLIAALDDINLLLDDKLMNEVIYAILKAHEEVEGARTGIIAIATDLKLTAKLDERVGSIFHPDEIYFPLYGVEEIHEILRHRCSAGFYPGVIDEDVIERVAELTYQVGDLRTGIYSLKMAGIEAERRASKKIEIEDVLKAFEGSRKVFLKKYITMLDETEKALLKLIYSSENITSGELYRKFRSSYEIGYTKFYNILSKLENIRLVDLVFQTLDRGRTRVVVKRFEPGLIEQALNEFG